MQAVATLQKRRRGEKHSLRERSIKIRGGFTSAGGDTVTQGVDSAGLML